MTDDLRVLWEMKIPNVDLPAFSDRGGPKKPRMPRKDSYLTVRTRMINGKPAGTITTKSGIKKHLAKLFRTCPARFDRRVGLRVVQYADRAHRQPPLEGEPLLDSDACLLAVRDALQEAGIVPDDVLLNPTIGWSIYRKGNPGLLVQIFEVE